MAAIHILTSISLLSLLAQSSFSQPNCTSHSFSSKTTTAYDNCNHLPTLNALLHWTFHPSTSSFSVAFTARPPNPTGWAAWALNPIGSGMLGAQALIAYRPSSGTPVSVGTYNIQSYATVTEGPISGYNVTGISAEESAAGDITIFATWRLPSGVKTVNQVWQVGPVVNGELSSHSMEETNLGSVMSLSLVTGPSSTPAASPVSRKRSPPLLPPPKSGAGDAVLSERSFDGSMIISLGICFLLFLL